MTAETAAPKAYVIVQEKVHDEARFETYRSKVMATLAPFGGRFLVRGGRLTTLEGSWVGARTVMLEFPSRAAAEGWYNSRAYQEILPLRLESVEGNLVIVDGV